MKELLSQYALYHHWANQQLFACILGLTDAAQEKEIVSSFSSISRTVHHLFVAESVWWQRMKLQERVVVPTMDASVMLNETIRQITAQNLVWIEWIANAGEHQLLHAFKYQNSKRESFKQPVYQVLLHVFNHGTYHRGQIVTMLRQLGINKVPSTDFVEWSRRK